DRFLSMANEHYFSAEPESELKLRPLTANPAGLPRTLTTAGGVSSPDRTDVGPQALLANTPPPPPAAPPLDPGRRWSPLGPPPAPLRRRAGTCWISAAVGAPSPSPWRSNHLTRPSGRST